jgi:cell division protein ZapB
MDADLKVLEKKVTQLILLCDTLRAENAELCLRLSTMESDSATLKSNMAQASERIESLLSSLP